MAKESTRVKYYRLLDDVHYPERWYLDDIEEVKNNWDLTIPENNKKIKNEIFHTKLYRSGYETDYTAGGYARIQYVSEKAYQALLTLRNIDSQVGFLPVLLRGCDFSQPYYVMVIRQSPLCVDEEKSEYDPIEYEEGETPTSRGFLNLYPAFYKLIIDPARTNNLDIFRLGGCSTYIIVSERLKAVWEKAGVTGATFTPVTD
jgi:hypothetical protein